MRATGAVSATNVLVRRKLGFARAIAVPLRREKEQVWLRPCDSDLFVASQIFGTRDYDLGTDVTNVEADPQTYAMLEANVSHHPNVSPRLAALWSHDRGVDLHFGSHHSWSNFVSERQSSPDNEFTPSVRLDQLVGTNERALLIKLDIEGSERDACTTSREILRSSPVIIIEPHDFMLPGNACLAPLLSALVGQDRDILISGENLVFLDRAIIAAALKGGSA